MTGLTGALTTTVAATPLFEPIQPMLAAEPETTGSEPVPGDLSGDIEFDERFRYPPRSLNTIDGVSLHLRQGGHGAFVGRAPR